MRKPALVIGFLAIVILALSVIKTFASNRISTSGQALFAIEDKINFYKIENALLSEKLYSLSSLTNLMSQANSSGFVKEKTSFVLTNPIPIALKQ